MYFLIFLKHQLVNISVTHSSLHALVIVSGENHAVYCVLVGLKTEYRFLIPCSIYLSCKVDKRRPIAKELTKYIHIHAVLFFLSLGKHKTYYFKKKTVPTKLKIELISFNYIWSRIFMQIERF